MEIEQGEKRLGEVVTAVIEHSYDLKGEVKVHSASEATMALNMELNKYRRENRIGFDKLPGIVLMGAIKELSVEHLAILFSGRVETGQLPSWTGQVTDYENLSVLDTSEKLHLMAFSIANRIGFLLSNRADALLGAGKDHQAFKDEVEFLMGQYNKIMEGVGQSSKVEREG